MMQLHKLKRTGSINAHASPEIDEAVAAKPIMGSGDVEPFGMSEPFGQGFLGCPFDLDGRCLPVPDRLGKGRYLPSPHYGLFSLSVRNDFHPGHLPRSREPSHDDCAGTRLPVCGRQPLERLPLGGHSEPWVIIAERPVLIDFGNPGGGAVPPIA
jgi:hypothetical protein